MQIIAASKGMKAPDGAKAMWIRPKPATEVQWENLAKHLKPSPELIKAYTKSTERNAYLRVTFPDDEETEGSADANSTEGYSRQPATHSTA